ncbi:MAG: type II toxin-antitoxin system HicB family antitoxin [Bacteroidales bacterium]|nr:type II toxin-antitoxin system HicB family antitoxin [Bacteroidales bacterium]
MKTKTRLTAIFEETEGGYIAYVKEINGINTQGDSIEEAKENLNDAIISYFQANREEFDSREKNLNIIAEDIELV